MGIDAINLALSLDDRSYKSALNENKRLLTSLGNVQLVGLRSGLKGTTTELRSMEAQAKKSTSVIQRMDKASKRLSIAGFGLGAGSTVARAGGFAAGMAGRAAMAARLGAVGSVLGPAGIAVGVTAGLAGILPGLSKLMKKSDAAVGSINGLGVAFSGVEPKAGLLSRGLGVLTGSLKLIGKTSAVVVAGVAAIGAAFVASQVKGLKLNSNLEKAKAQFEVFTGSALKADAIINMLSKRAQVTPFETADYIEGGAALMSAAEGSKDKLLELTKTAEMLTVLNSGEGLTGAATAIKNALSGDYVSFQDRFNIDRATLHRLKEAGLQGNELIRAVLKSMGITEASIGKVANTLEARLATARSFIDEIRQKLSAGLFAMISEKVGHLTTWLSANQAWIMDIATGLGMQMVETIMTVGVHLAALWESTKVIGFTAFEFFKTLPEALKASFVSGELVNGFVKLITGLSSLAWDALKLLGGLIADGFKLGALGIITYIVKAISDKSKEFLPDWLVDKLGLGVNADAMVGSLAIQKQAFVDGTTDKLQQFGADAASRLSSMASGVGNFVQQPLQLSAAQTRGQANAEAFNNAGGMKQMIYNGLLGEGGPARRAYEVGARTRQRQEAAYSQIHWPTAAAKAPARPEPSERQLQMMEMYNAMAQMRPQRNLKEHANARRERMRIDLRVTSMDAGINPLSR